MPEYQRETLQFDLTGISLTGPVDRLPQGKVRYAKNVRPYGRGRAQGRQGLDLVSISGTTGNPAHSEFSFDDPIASPSTFPGAFSARTRLMGSGTELRGAVNATNPTAFQTLNGTTYATGYSGKPMSFAVANNDQTPRPWTFIGDFNKLTKVSSALLVWPWGVAPPNFAPVIAIDAANPNGPDIGTSPNPYIYAFRARTDTLVNTGAVSNLGPAVRLVNGLSPSSAPGAADPPSNILITLPQAHPDQAPAGQVATIDVFRWGGSLPVWKYMGSMPNIAGSTIIDSFADSDLASAEEAQLDDNQPFLSTDVSHIGSALLVANGTGLGTTMIITSGDPLLAYNATGSSPYYIAGNQVSVAGLQFTFYASPDSATTVQLLEDPPVPVITSPFTLITPATARQALPCVWGPFGGGQTGIFIFGCGDPFQGGSLYWTKGNQPESHPGSNSLALTSNSEPLMNGCLYNGSSYVFSTKRMFSIYPTLGDVTDFRALEIPNSKGLFARWGLAVCPQGIAFIGKDGIYLTSGGQPQSLTDADLYPIFPHEGTAASSFPQIDGMSGITFPTPDFNNPDKMRLTYGDGFLYFDYLGQDEAYHTLVFDFSTQGWVSVDDYTPQIISRYFEIVHDETTGGSWNKTLMGSIDGKMFQYGGGGSDNAGNAIAGHIRTGSNDAGDSRPRKLWGDLELDMDGQCDTFDVKGGFDNYSFLSSLGTAGTNIHGRHRVTCDINAGLGQYGYNLGLDIQWSVTTSQPILYFWVPTRLAKPELTALRATDWENGGYEGPKFVQGFRLHADTLNQTRQIAALSDGGVIQETFSVLHPNEQTVDYWFTTPFISHLLRLSPKDAKFWRIFGVEWIYNIAPPLAAVWTTQETTLDLSGYIYHRAAMPAYISFNDPVILTCTVNGNPSSPFTYTFPAGNGLFLKPYQLLQHMKAREIQYSLTSICPFRLFVKDSEIIAKQWGSDGPFRTFRPFGDLSRDKGATI